jgi:hypothetical protein
MPPHSAEWDKFYHWYLRRYADLLDELGCTEQAMETRRVVERASARTTGE